MYDEHSNTILHLIIELLSFDIIMTILMERSCSILMEKHNLKGKTMEELKISG
jgi:hypothetical protein